MDNKDADLVALARIAVDEMRRENQNGWPNLVEALADRLEAISAENARQREAVQFVARWMWDKNISEAERLSVVKHHPAISAAAKE